MLPSMLCPDRSDVGSGFVYAVRSCGCTPAMCAASSWLGPNPSDRMPARGVRGALLACHRVRRDACNGRPMHSVAGCGVGCHAPIVSWASLRFVGALTESGVARYSVRVQRCACTYARTCRCRRAADHPCQPPGLNGRGSRGHCGTCTPTTTARCAGERELRVCDARPEPPLLVAVRHLLRQASGIAGVSALWSGLRPVGHCPHRPDRRRPAARPGRRSGRVKGITLRCLGIRA